MGGLAQRDQRGGTLTHPPPPIDLMNIALSFKLDFELTINYTEGGEKREREVGGMGPPRTFLA